eukprot:CAMPEP_0170509962 /NCGR_PEP_ID=MMETSP0208-20121228/65502_1 /TAXON_ID=197538 /ORGANISM="Strombidium inclinatum, Strain S3" /LENGTH=128 /DNA_ID=CAMNT_0010793373 /DNA_START=438 /DNA_END=824 /DNA_ORIENTATION=+
MPPPIKPQPVIEPPKPIYEPPPQEEPLEEFPEEEYRRIVKRKKRKVINFIEENKKHLKGRPPREPAASYVTTIVSLKPSKSAPKLEDLPSKKSPKKTLKKSASQKPAPKRGVSKKKKKTKKPEEVEAE